MIRLFEAFPQELKEEVLEYRVNKNKKQTNFSGPVQPIEFAYKRLKKLPLSNKRNVMAAFHHFEAVVGTSEEERQEAFKKIIKAAESFELCTMEFKDKNSKYNY